MALGNPPRPSSVEWQDYHSLNIRVSPDTHNGFCLKMLIYTFSYLKPPLSAETQAMKGLATVLPGAGLIMCSLTVLPDVQLKKSLKTHRISFDVSLSPFRGLGHYGKRI